MVGPPADKELEKIYDREFDRQASNKHGRAGSAHIQGLRAVYERGRRDAEKEARGDERPESG